MPDRVSRRTEGDELAVALVQCRHGAREVESGPSFARSPGAGRASVKV